MFLNNEWPLSENENPSCFLGKRQFPENNVDPLLVYPPLTQNFHELYSFFTSSHHPGKNSLRFFYWEKKNNTLHVILYISGIYNLKVVTKLIVCNGRSPEEDGWWSNVSFGEQPREASGLDTRRNFSQPKEISRHATTTEPTTSSQEPNPSWHYQRRRVHQKRSQVTYNFVTCFYFYFFPIFNTPFVSKTIILPWTLTCYAFLNLYSHSTRDVIAK